MANQYKPADDEKKLITFVQDRYDKALSNFKNNNQTKFDQYYKNYRDYNGDRAALLTEQNRDWASNVFIPITSGYVRGVSAKVTDSKPELKVIGRNPDDMVKAEKVQTLLEYIWDKNPMEQELKSFTNQAEVFGTAIGKVSWKKKYIKSTKDVVDDENLEIKQITEVKEEFDDPAFETVDIYGFFPDPQGHSLDSCRYVIQRYLMTKQQIFATYGKDNLNNTEFFQAGSGDLTIYDGVRGTVNNVKNTGNTPKATAEQIEVIEYWEDDKFVLMVGGVIAKNDVNPFPFKKKPYVKVCYEDLPFEFYGVGIPEQLAGSQELINKIRNQRIDNVSMSLQQMFIINDMAIPEKSDLDMRPGGHIRVLGQDINSAITPLPMPGVAGTAYQEDQLVFDAARTATGLDSYSIGQSQAASSSASSVIAAKEASALRIKQFVRNIEYGLYDPLFRMWLELAKKFYPSDVVKQVVNEDGQVVSQYNAMDKDFRKEENGQFSFEQISKDDLMGYFDFRVLSDSGVAASKELNKQNVLNLLDRAASVGSDPQTGESYINKKELWGEVFNTFGIDKSKFMGQNTQQQKQTAQNQQQQFTADKNFQQQQQLQGGSGTPDLTSQQSNANLSGINAPKQPGVQQN